MKKRKQRLDNAKLIALVGAAGIIGLVAVILLLPTTNPGAEDGFGADGYNVRVRDDGSLGIADAVSKDTVNRELGGYINSLSDVRISKVISVNGSLGQTATYTIRTNEGRNIRYYTDVMQYKNDKELARANVDANTTDAGTVQNIKARFMKPYLLGNNIEHALLITKGLRSYKFAIVQPLGSSVIDNTSAQAALKRIASDALLK